MRDEPLSLDEDDDRPRRRRRPAPRGKVPVWGWVLIGLGAFAVAIGGGVALLLVLSERNRTYTQTTPDEIADEWAKNPAAAQEKYKRNGAEFTGRWADTGKTGDGSNQMVITVTGAKSTVSVYVVDDRAKRGLEKCKVGGRVTVKARTTENVHGTPLFNADEISPAD